MRSTARPAAVRLAATGVNVRRGSSDGRCGDLLEPHGGDLGGFALLRGSREQLDAVRAGDDVQRVNTRAALVVDRFGFVDAHVGDGLGRQMALYHQQVGDLT